MGKKLGNGQRRKIRATAQTEVHVTAWREDFDTGTIALSVRDVFGMKYIATLTTAGAADLARNLREAIHILPSSK
ncbi:hypothetical protein D3C76_283670 [compost metagenome]